MNKSEMIDKVAEEAELSHADAGRAVSAVINSIGAALKSSEPVVIAGFGTFRISQRNARAGRNPRTGEPIQIKASRVPAFKAGKAFKELVN